jgi:hypothetical protein
MEDIHTKVMLIKKIYELRQKFPYENLYIHDGLGGKDIGELKIIYGYYLNRITHLCRQRDISLLIDIIDERLDPDMGIFYYYAVELKELNSYNYLTKEEKKRIEFLLNQLVDKFSFR